MKEAFHAKAQATRALLSGLTRSSQRQSEPDDIRQKCLQAQSEVRISVIIYYCMVYNIIIQLASLRSQLAVSQEALTDLRTQRDELHHDLQLANTRLDRQNSRTVRATHPRSASTAPEGVNGDVKIEPTSATATPVRAVSGRRFVV